MPANLPRLAFRLCRTLSCTLSRTLFCTLCWLAFAAGLNFAAAQTKLDAAYSATLLGLPIGHVYWTVELRDNQFDSSANGELAGLLRIFSDGHADVAAHGQLSAGKPLASEFVLKVVAGRWSDDVRIVYHGGKAREFVAAATASSNPKLVPLTDANRVGAIDPMTALLVHIPGTGAVAVPEACERTVAVFDGHTRYNLRLAFKRLDEVKSDEGYEGPVVVCSTKFLPIAGYDPKHFLITYLAAQHGTEIWLAPIAGSRLMVPYRMSMPTPMGLGILQATKFVSLPAPSQSERK